MSEPTQPLEFEAIAARAKAAREMVSALCKPRGEEGAREWIMSIPARPDHDPDLVIAAALADIGPLLEEREQLIEQIALHEPSAVERDMQEVMRINNELVAVMQPFSAAADKADAKAAEVERLGMGRLTDNASTGLGITFGHVRAVRALLARLATSTVLQARPTDAAAALKKIERAYFQHAGGELTMAEAFAVIETIASEAVCGTTAVDGSDPCPIRQLSDLCPPIGDVAVLRDHLAEAARIKTPITLEPTSAAALSDALELIRTYRDIFAEITAKANPADDSDPVRRYSIPVGPIHRAAGKLGFQMFDGEKHLAKAVADLAESERQREFWFQQASKNAKACDAEAERRIAAERAVAAERDNAIGLWMRDKAAVSAAIGSVRFMDSPEVGSPSLAEQVSRMRDALARAEQAAEEMGRARDQLRDAFNKPFAVVFLDGRNEHGTHVLASYPTNIPEDQLQPELNEYAEEIMSKAEALGFAIGDHVWTEWKLQRYDEAGGAWEFVGIDPEIMRLLSPAEPALQSPPARPQGG